MNNLIARTLIIGFALIHFGFVSKWSQVGADKRPTPSPRTNPSTTQSKRATARPASNSRSRFSRLVSFIGFHFGDTVAQVSARLGQPDSKTPPKPMLTYFNGALRFNSYDGLDRIETIALEGREAIEGLRLKGISDDLFDDFEKPLSALKQKYGEPDSIETGYPPSHIYNYKIKGYSNVSFRFEDSADACSQIRVNWSYSTR